MVKQQAMTQFKLEDVKAINQQQKAQATLTLITQKAGKAIGDLERTQNSSSNRYRQNLAKMNDMLDSLSTKLNKGFGSDLIMWMTKGLDLAEDLVDEINKLTSSGTENLIRDLRSNNADPELIAKLEEAQALADAQKLKRSIEKELRDIKVPVNIDEASLRDKTKGFLSSLKESFGVNGLFSGKSSIFNIGQQIKDVRQALADFKIEEEGFQSGNLDKYKQRLDEMVVSLKNLLELSIEARKNGFDEEAVLFISEANAYGDAISQLAEIIAKMERVNQINDQLRNKGGVVLEQTVIEQTVKVTGESVEKFVSDIERIELKPVKIGVNVEPKVDTDKFDTVLSSSFSKISAKYLKEITKLNNMFATDMISEDKFLKDSEVTTIAFKEALIDLYKEAKELGKLTPELEKAFNKALGEMNDGTKEAKTNLDDIADAVSSLLSVADAFGKIDDNLKNVLRGGIDVLRNLQNIQELQDAGKFSGIGAVVPLIGLAGGVGSIISGMFQNEDIDNSAAIELDVSIQEQIRALKKNTEALLASDIVGGEYTDSDISRIQKILDNFDNLKRLSKSDDGVVARELSTIEDEFPDLFAGIQELYADLLEDGFSEREALDKLYNLYGGSLEDLINNFGNYGNSLQGAITKFQDSINLGLVPLQEAFDTLVQDLKDIGLNLGNEFYRAFIMEGDVVGFVEELIKELSSSETSDERRDEIIAALFNNQDSLRGDLTPEEFKELLNFLKGIDPDAGFTGGSEVSRSVAVSSSITEFQANEMVTWLQALNFTADMQLDVSQQQAQLLRDQIFLLSNLGSNENGVAHLDLGPELVQSNNNSFQVNVSGVTFSDQEINSITNQIARELKTYAK